MKHDLHHSQAVKASSHIVDYDAYSFGEAFELAHRRRFDDIERSKKYKAQQQRLPRDRRCNQSDELAGDFVDHHKLWVLATTGPRHLCSSRNSNQNRSESHKDRNPGLPAGHDPARHKPPQKDRCCRTPSPRSRT
jgi:hypothetical protein